VWSPNQVSTVPNMRVETPLSPLLPTPLRAFSNSSTKSTHGEWHCRVPSFQFNALCP
jgi:hypothetical protein